MTHLWVPQFAAKDLTISEEIQLYSGYCGLKRFAFQFLLFEGGRSGTTLRECLDKSDAVAVLLYDPDADKVVMIEQIRVGAFSLEESPWILEIVAGVIEFGDNIEETIYREVEEESGCQIISLVPICEYLTTPGISNEKIFVYCAKIKAPTSSEVHGLLEEGEDIKIHIFSTQEVFTLLSEGKIISSPAIIALQWLKINLSTLRFPQ